MRERGATGRGAAARFVPYADPLVPAIEAQRFAPGHVAEGFGLHGHAFHEVVIFESGAGTHRVGREMRPVHRGAIDVVAEGVVHDLRELREARGWMLMLRADAVLSLGTHATRPVATETTPRLAASEDALVRLGGLCAAIAEERSAARPGCAEAVRALATLALVEIRRIAPVPSAPANDGVARLVAFVDANLTGDVRLVEIARALGYTPAHLSADVRRRSGRTVTEWVAARRLNAACRQLLETNDVVDRVARDAGFVDASHLARRFRRQYGLSPTAWRLAHRTSPRTGTP